MQEAVDALSWQFVAALTKGLTKDTPKDTGFASINWIPTIGAKFQGTAGYRADAVHAGILKRDVQRAHLSLLRKYKSSMGRLYLTNNTSYIAKLNNGSSAQAPRAFIQKRVEITKFQFNGRDFSLKVTRVGGLV